MRRQRPRGVILAGTGITLPAPEPGPRRRPPTPPRPAVGANVWRLWFAARPYVPPALRGRTKSGKPKPSPPRLPPNINERTRLHWRTERRLTAYWKQQAWALAKAQQLPALGKIRVSAVIHRDATGKADRGGDEERLKPLLDGLVQAGVVPDDTYASVTLGDVSECRSSSSIRGIELIIEEMI